MKKLLFGTNLKMHKTSAEVADFVTALVPMLRGFEECQFFIIPPYTALARCWQHLKDTPILLGAQNCHWEKQGPYTGEISVDMLKEVGVNLIETGHSERRQYYNENDFDINKKVKAIVSAGLTALICVGEPEAEKDYGVSFEYIKRQVKIALNDIDSGQLSHVWIAYEPVWAIGEQGKPAQPDYVDGVHQMIKETLDEMFGNAAATIVPVLYGGSVNPENGKALFSQPHINGLFVGRSAWEADLFFNMVSLVVSSQSVK